MPFTLAAVCTALSLSACTPPEPPRMLTPFFEDDFRFWSAAGVSSLEGTATIKLADGQVVNCSSVNLLPATAYNLELEQHLEKGMGYPADYSRHARPFDRSAACDGNGHFSIGNLPSLKWIVVAHLNWSEDSSVPGVTEMLGKSSKGGWIFQEKTLAGGSNTLILTKDDLVPDAD